MAVTETTEAEDSTDEMTSHERLVDLADQMARHMNENPHKSFRVSGCVWVGGYVVRVYSSVDSFAELREQDGDYTYRHCGKDRGSIRSFEAAWDAAE